MKPRKNGTPLLALALRVLSAAKLLFYKGVRRMKLLTSRQVSDVCIFRIKGMEVFL